MAIRVGGDPQALVRAAVKYARREGFGYGAAFGAIAAVVIRRLLDWLWP